MNRHLFTAALIGLLVLVSLSVVPVAMAADQGLAQKSSFRDLIPTKKFVGDNFIVDFGGYFSSVILGVIGAAMFLVVAYGGWQWLTASGNEDKITAARQTIVWAVLGGVMAFAAYGLVSYLITFATTAATTK
ncbi:MAG: hypothetical protein AAB817_01485 [Patescibacteria group bacterium]